MWTPGHLAEGVAFISPGGQSSRPTRAWLSRSFTPLGRMMVRSPKTEHHAGLEQRLVPITPTLMPILQEAFDAAQEGQELLVTLGKGGQLHRRLQAIVRQAGVEPWPRAFQTLRSSCEKEWARDFPQYAVSKWMGHSITVSGKHYVNEVPDELFDQAAAMESGALHNPVQHSAASARNASQGREPGASQKAHKPSDCEGLRSRTTVCGHDEKWSRGGSNPRAGTVSRLRLHV